MLVEEPQEIQYDPQEAPIADATDIAPETEQFTEITAEVEIPATAEENLPEVEVLDLDIEKALDFEIHAMEPTPEANEVLPIAEEIEIIDSPSWPEDNASEPEQTVADAPAAIPQEYIASITAVPEPEPPPPVTIVDAKSSRRTPFWLLAVLAFLLGLMALVQSIYFLRNSIAAHYPQANPWLASLCQPLHCSIDLPRQADLLSIEDSDLKDDPEHDGVLVLVSMLDNRATFTQAMPLLELTLTDTFDHPLLRRTFTPQEYLPAGISATRGMAAGGQIPIRLNLRVDGDKPAGYRLYVKY